MSSPPAFLSHPKYRPDIDGLRAIAVLSVVIFHAFPSFIKGGFIGVDIFFVISGYLISTIIFENLDNGTFNFKVFYARRIKRIFPALLLVFISSYIFGWFFLLQSEYGELGKHIAAGAAFISNIILWNESGYFDTSSELKPLLHLWSLGIEEQFYIIWPFIIWFCWKKKFNIFLILFISALSSFILNLYNIKSDPTSTFYLPQTRFWELLSGSILAWATIYKKNHINPINPSIKKLNKIFLFIQNNNIAINTLSFIAILLLAYGFLRINKSLNFPGIWALIPVIATILIILSGPSAWINKNILSNRIFIWFGLISFPLYLWHWPLLTFARIVEEGVPNSKIRLALLIASIALAWLTYKFIESPLRKSKSTKNRVLPLIILMTAMGCLGYYTYVREGFPEREFHQKISSFNESINRTSRIEECFEIPYAYKKDSEWFCSLGNKDLPVTYFAYGDSHALSLVPALENFAISNQIRINFTGSSGCPPLLGVQSMRGTSNIEKHNCKELNERVFDYVRSNKIGSVILASRWTYYTESFSRPLEFNPIARDTNSSIDKSSSTKDLIWSIKNTVERYTKIGVTVIFIEDTPQQIYDPRSILRKGQGIESEYLKYSVTTIEHQKNQNMINNILRSTKAKTINFDDLLCNESICPILKNSKFLYFDDDHLSVEGALLISRALSERLKQK